MNEVTVQLIYLGIAVIGCAVKGLWGFLQSGESFNWRLFAVSTIPAVFIMGATVFTYEPVLTLQTSFYILMAAAGLAEAQSMALRSIGTSNRTLGYKIF